ncbi:deoxyribose-phosphate aldolase [Treponema phagedenis]|uniref:Deoxyribose-phosphate aldolase n=1 Tax=Treponema phagedenis TaxID=162 RepID=A0A0B7GYM3_TREPH|nr:deoxyribose-phosphate aldolase [Treponema phagedenis]EFW37836.1 deoxyribose-phosphate aldolase [Treponema phagedenis F0421]NVP24697.1 deoxyribose-phosphate aldolase [Treponema phagedenis]QEJ95713.1 deoxyribose-phosphate aldolase [Treponema phagedenis]QEJ98813.1 deoxyribose-phosphate aldolase [Treponema phagedenis]QEK00521.1 deoxyribose-phosphate aldolase [Treponema phagedenis]
MEMNKYIDHTLLKPNAVEDDIIRICDEAKKYEFASVCVNPCNVAIVKKALADTTVKTCSVIGFPFGTQVSAIKLAEAEQAIADGAEEIDMVINIGKLLEGNTEFVTKEIKTIADACHKKNALLKVIVETCYLEEKNIADVCACVENANADFIKTSTGYGSRGASTDDIKLFKKYLKKDTKIKASGGIRTKADAEMYIELGCSRIGTSNGVGIIEG